MARHKNDAYNTPSWCVRRMTEAIHLPRGATYLEPCVGGGAIWHAVGKDRDWILYDIDGHKSVPAAQHRNFLETELPWGKVDYIVTNPPYSLALEFAEHSLTMAHNTIMLLRLSFLGSKRRSAFIAATKPDVYVLPNRPSFTGRGTDSCEYAWFHWHKNSAGKYSVLALTPISERKQSNE